MLFEELASHPGQMMLCVARNMVKYILVPVESVAARLTERSMSEQAYLTHVRPILGLLCLPIWILALSPPPGSPKTYRMYYFLVVMFLLYVVGVTAMAPLQGERIRFPVLVFMLPVVAWNVHRLHSYLMQALPGRTRHRA
jgi:hypothetical protein